MGRVLHWKTTRLKTLALHPEPKHKEAFIADAESLGWLSAASANWIIVCRAFASPTGIVHCVFRSDLSWIHRVQAFCISQFQGTKCNKMLSLFSLFGRGTLGAFFLPHFDARGDVVFCDAAVPIESGKSSRCGRQHCQHVTAADDGTALDY